MIHIIVAQKLAITKSVSDFSQFYLGILAPDVYHSKKEKSLEDRNTTHFIVDDAANWLSETIRFIHEFENDKQKWFYLGYGIHILTDICWDSMIYKPFLMNDLQEKEASISKLRQIYTSDMTKIDLWLYRDFDLKDDIWEFLFRGRSFDVKDLVTAEEIDIERDFTLAWYDENIDQNIENFKYINPEKVNDFMQRATERIDSLLIPIF